MNIRPLVFLAGLALAHIAFAQVTIAEPWVRGTAPVQKATGAFMTLTAKTTVKLVEVKSPLAGIVELHEMSMDNNVMKMRAVPALDLPAGKAVELKPGGYHVMLMALKQPLKAGDTVPLTMVFEGADKQRETLEVNAPVRALGAPAAPMEHKQQHQH